MSAEADYTSASDQAAAIAAVNNVNNAVINSLSADNAFLPYIFQNEAGYGQNVLASYGSANLKALQLASQKYDPNRVFQNLQNNGFLLRNVT
jgi:hypothetical protein